MTAAGNEASGTPQPGRSPLQATVVEVLPNALFRLRLEDGSERLAHVAGNLRMGFTRLLAGDVVQIDPSPFDSSKARIVAIPTTRPR